MSQAETIERWLGKPLVQYALRQLTRRRNGDACFMNRAMASYGRSELPLGERFRYALPHFGIEWLRKRTGASVEMVRDSVLGNEFWSRGLLNAARGIGEFGLGKPQTFSAPLMVVWNFTQACNLQCRHCYQNAGTPRGVELSADEKLRVLDELASNDVPMLAFSGGEPLMGRDFWPTLAAARARGFHISVATNGTLLTKETVARLAETGADYVEVSIDSIDPEQHDAFRGHRGYWEKSIRGLRNLVEDGRLQTGLAHTITAQNIDRLEDIIEMAEGIGVSTFYIFNFIPTGRARDIIEMDIDPQQRESMLASMQTHLNEHRMSVMGTAPQLARRCMQHYYEGGMVTTGHYGASTHRATQIFSRYVGGCGAGRCLAAVQPNGDITPCVFLPIVVGNLRDRRFETIWRQSTVFQQLRDRDLLKGHCHSCKWRAYCGGCRARAYAYFDDITAPDPGCIFNTEAWEQLQAHHSQRHDDVVEQPDIDIDADAETEAELDVDVDVDVDVDGVDSDLEAPKTG